MRKTTDRGTPIIPDSIRNSLILSRRRVPWGPAGFWESPAGCPLKPNAQRMPSPNILFNLDNAEWGGGAGIQSSWAYSQPKFHFSVRLCPILASVSLRQLPSPHIVDFRQHDMWEGGSEAKVPVPLFSLNFSFQCCFPNFTPVSFRKLQWASLDFRLHIYW